MASTEPDRPAAPPADLVPDEPAGPVPGPSADLVPDEPAGPVPGPSADLVPDQPTDLVPDQSAGSGPGPSAEFVPDPAVRAELARRMSELAGLVEEAGEALGQILAEVQRGGAGTGGETSRGRDSAERSRGASRSST